MKTIRVKLVVSKSGMCEIAPLDDARAGFYKDLEAVE